MGKLDTLRKSAVGNIDESMGAGRDAAGAGGGIPGVSSPAPRTLPARLQGLVRSQNAAEIPIDRIVRDPAQPREDFDEEALERLAGSLKARGQLQPIRVRWDEGQGRYVLICGERRWRAARLAGLATLTCVIAEAPPDAAELLAMQLVENALREDLRPIEQALAFRSLMKANGWSGNQLAKELAIAQPTVVRALALLDLPAPVQEKVEEGTLAPATAYEVSKLDDPGLQAEVANRVVREGLTRSQAVEVVRESGRAGQGRGGTSKAKARPKGRKETVRTFRVAGCTLTVENRRGLDDALIVRALEAALAQVGGEARGREEAA